MIRIFLVCFCLITISKAELNDSNLEKWLLFKKKYSGYLKLTISSSNENARFNVFKDNMLGAERVNKKNAKTYQLGETIFSHMKYKEFSDKFLIKKNYSNKLETFKVGSQYFQSNSSSTYDGPVVKAVASGLSGLPTFVNWTARGKVFPVLYQGACGSCYSFSASGAVSSAYAIRYDKDPIVLSDQQVLDCTNQFFKDSLGRQMRNFGCYGGDVFNTLLYIQTYGITTIYSYPYVSGTTGRTQSCMYDTRTIFARISDVKWINGANINELKSAVSQQPITAYFYVDPNFLLYKSGIYSSQYCMIAANNCNNFINHAVLITGYGVENDVEYWIVKNSWSTNWGENGYFRIPLGRNSCCIETGNFKTLIN